jgi:hypothetical protein
LFERSGNKSHSKGSGANSKLQVVSLISSQKVSKHLNGNENRLWRRIVTQSCADGTTSEWVLRFVEHETLRADFILSLGPQCFAFLLADKKYRK